MIVCFGGLTIGGIFVAKDIIYNSLKLLVEAGVDFSGVNEAILNTVLAIICYIIALAIAIGIPWIMFKHRTTPRELGLLRFPTWSEIGLAPAGLVVYFLTSAVVMYLVMQLFSGFDADQAQEIGFTHLGQSYEYVIAFLTLVVIAPIAEETLFRGYLFGKLKRWIPWWGSAVITSILFGYAHGQWNVAIDTFVLSVFACILREITGSLWPSIFLHALKNGLAYYLIFINPTLLGL